MNRRRLLIVDDNPEDRRRYRRLLGPAEGWEVLEADSGEAGLEHCRIQRPDCVLLDYLLPDPDGLEFLERLEREVDAPVAVVMVTGQGNERVAAEALRKGARDYLVKDGVTRESLLRALENACEKVRLQAQLLEEQASLRASNEELLRRAEELQRFHRTLSHEMRTPLTAAREFVVLVLETAAERLSDQDRRCLGLARDACEQMSVCIDDLLDATRLETGKLSVHPQPGALDLLVPATVETTSRMAHERQLTLRHEVESDLPAVAMDEPRIRQVLTNLLTNAIKFSPPGSEIVVRVHRAASRPGWVIVDVVDAGPGVPLEAQEQIFVRYAQVRKTDASQKGGLGLGLSICRELLRLHDGDLWLESVPGKGSTFSFSLPVARRETTGSGH